MIVSRTDNAIFALHNKTDKRIYISYSSRLHQRLGTILSEIVAGEWKFKTMVEDKDKLELIILDNTNTKNFVKYFIDQYRKQGYYIYNDTDKLPLTYRFRIEYTTRAVLVVAVNKRNEKEILGEFQYAGDAHEFLAYVMQNNPSKSLVYAI